MRVLLLICLTFAGSGLVIGQEAPKDKAVVYVYAYVLGSGSIGTVRKSLLLDGKKLAAVTPGRYFIGVIEPGLRSLHYDDKKRGGLEYDFKAGTISYVRADFRDNGFTIKANGLELVGKETGSFDIKQLRPVEMRNIKDKDRAMMALP